MSSRRAVGIAPLVVGLAGLPSNVQLLLATVSADGWTTTALGALAGSIGGLAAILVGAGILLGWRGFETCDPGEESERNQMVTRSTPALLGIAAVSFALGFAVYAF